MIATPTLRHGLMLVVLTLGVWSCLSGAHPWNACGQDTPSPGEAPVDDPSETAVEPSEEILETTIPETTIPETTILPLVPGVDYRVLRVPEGDLKEKARGHIGVDRARFIDELRQIRDARSVLPANRTELRSAMYQATWNAGQLVGTAELGVTLHGDRPLPLDLSQLKLAVDSLYWKSRPDETVALRVGADGETMVFVEQSDVLVLAWSHAAQTHLAAGSESVRLELPSCPVRRMQIRLPASRLLRASEGVLVRRGAVNAGESPERAESRDRSVSSSSAQQGMWTVELGGAGTVELTSYPADNEKNQSVPGVVRTQMGYDVRPRGVDWVCDVRCELNDPSLREFVFEIPQSVQVVSVTSPGVAGRWNVGPADEADRRLLRYELREPAGTTTFPIRVSGLVSAPVAEAAQLPQLVVRDLQWREGTATVRIFDPFLVTHWGVTGGRYTNIRRLADSDAGEVREVQLHTTDVQIELQVAMAISQQSVSSGWQVRVGGPKVVATGTVDLRQEGATAFSVRCRVPSPWQVDAITCEDVERLDRWEIVGQEGGAAEIEVLFAQALRPGESLRLHYDVSRGGLPAGYVLRDADIHAVHFPDARVEQRLMSVIAVPGQVLRTAAAQQEEADATPAPQQVLRSESPTFWAWLTPDMLTNEELERLPAPGAWCYRAEMAVSDMAMVLVPQQPEFAADISVTATLQESNLVWDAVIQCSPASAVPDRLLVHFSQGGKEPPVFTSSTPASGIVTSRRLSPSEEEQLGFKEMGETWEISSFRGPGDRVEIHVELTSEIADLTQSTGIPLLQLPSASAQAGLVELFSKVRRIPEVFAASDLQAIPTLHRSEDSSSGRSIATYRYSTLPTKERGELLAVRFPVREDATPAWVSRMLVHTRYLASGSALYTVELKVQNRGARQIALSVPQNVRMRRTMVDGVPLNVGTRPMIAVDLPSGAQEVDVLAEYSIPEAAWAPLGDVIPNLLHVDVPVLERIWRVRLPAEYGAWRTTSGFHRNVVDKTTWLSRFLGPHVIRGADEDRRSWEASGATAYDVQFLLRPGDLEYKLSYYHAPTLLIVSWGVGLLTSAIATFWLRGTGRRYLVLAFFSGILVLWVEPPLYRIFAGLFWGLVATTVVRSYATSIGIAGGLFALSRTSEERSAATSRPMGTTALRAIIGIAVGCWCCPGAAQQTLPTTTEEITVPAPPVYRVVIPMDENLQPTGNYVYPDEAFFQWMRREVNRHQETSASWWVENARYVVRLIRSSETGRIETVECDVHWDMVSRTPGTRIVLPGSQQWRMANRRPMMIDGRDVLFRRAPDGGLIVTLDRAGNYHLQANLVATPRELGGLMGVDFDIVSHPMAMLEIESPNGINLRVPTAIGSLSRAVGKDRVMCALGATDQLQLRWDSEDTPSMMPYDVVRGARYTHFQIRPNAVAMDVRWEFDWGEEAVSQLRWVADARLKPMPIPASVGRLETVARSDGKQDLILTLSEAWRGKRTLNLAFVATEVSGVGTVALPELTLQSSMEVTHWLGLDVAASLAYETDRANIVAISRNDFVAAWGDSVDIDMACEMISSHAAWSVKTATLPPDCEASERLVLIYGPEGCRWEYLVDVNPVRGAFLEYNVEVPPGVEVDRCLLETNGTRRRLRWSATGNELVTVYLRAGQNTRHRLIVAGTVDVVAEALSEIPRFSLLQGGVVARSLQVFRDPRVDVRLTPPPQWTEMRSAEMEVTADGYRRVAGYQVPLTSNEWAKGVVRPNRPIVRGQTITTLRQKDGQWWADLRCQVTPQNGSIDRITLAMSDVFGNQPPFSPSNRVESHKLADGRHRVTVYLPEPTADVTWIAVEVPLQTAPTNRFPSVMLLDVLDSVSFVRLPTQDASGPLLWTPRGLVEHPEPLTAAEKESSSDTGEYVAYRVDAEPPRLDVRREVVSVAAPEIPVWQVDCRLTESGTSGDVEFFVGAVGKQGVLLNVEPGCKIVHATVDGQWVLANARDDVTWHLPVADTGLPRRVQVTFQAPPLPIGKQPTRWLPVRPVDIQPQLVLWSVTAPEDYEVQATLRRIDRATVGRERWMAEVELLSQAIAKTGNARVPALERWVWLWTQRLQAQRLLLSEPLNVDTDQRWRGAAEQWRAIYELQILTDVAGDPLLDGFAAPPDAGPTVDDSVAETQTTYFFDRELTLPFAGLEITGPEETIENERLLAIGLWSVVTAALSIVLANRRLTQFWGRFVHLLWAVVGVIWLTNATPQWPGIVAVIVGMLATLLVNLPATQPPATTLR